VNRLSLPSQERLLTWFERVKREMPWRGSKDPYAIWVSEIMLQQTQVATVIPYFDAWMAKFPTVQALANATQDEVLAAWQGLGYYRRCRLLHAGAQRVAAAGMPKTAREWSFVPGVGPYTAAAIASIAFGEPVGLVDGNVTRVFARLVAAETAGPQLEKDAWTWARENVAANSPGSWNQALMELGATVCKPKLPDCPNCPLVADCQAYQLDLTDRLPRVTPKIPTKALTDSCVILIFDDLFGVERIPAGQWWEYMWRFPQPSKSQDLSALKYLGTVSHTVTHHRIKLAVYTQTLECKEAVNRWVDAAELEEIAMPSPQRKAVALFNSQKPNLFD
jgi:A/G-specific adenine glycosylase